jgi:hypothetical protein
MSICRTQVQRLERLGAVCPNKGQIVDGNDPGMEEYAQAKKEERRTADTLDRQSG